MSHDLFFFLRVPPADCQFFDLTYRRHAWAEFEQFDVSSQSKLGSFLDLAGPEQERTIFHHDFIIDAPRAPKKEFQVGLVILEYIGQLDLAILRLNFQSCL